MPHLPDAMGNKAGLNAGTAALDSWEPSTHTRAPSAPRESRASCARQHQVAGTKSPAACLIALALAGKWAYLYVGEQRQPGDKRPNWLAQYTTVRATPGKAPGFEVVRPFRGAELNVDGPGRRYNMFA